MSSLKRELYHSLSMAMIVLNEKYYFIGQLRNLNMICLRTSNGIGRNYLPENIHTSFLNVDNAVAEQ